MPLADDLAAADPTRPGPRCTVGVAIESMSDDDRAALAAAFARSDLPTTRIAEILQANGYDLKALTVHRHRKGECRCPRSDDSPTT